MERTKSSPAKATRSQQVSKDTSMDEDGDGVVDESDCEYPICGEIFEEQSATWIQSNNCEEWYEMECAGIDKL